MIVEKGKLIQECRVFSGWANVNKLKKFIEGGFQPQKEEDGDFIFYLSENGVIYYKKTRDKARHILSVLRNMGTTEQMRSALENMGIIFQYPKPLELTKYLIQIGAKSGSIILDFFAGSCTTAQAVLEQNKEDGGNRKFICVQLPEPCDENSEAFKAGFKTIADIGKERIRRVIQKIKKEIKDNRLPLFPDKNPTLDLGFKVFKLSSSNFKLWDTNAPKEKEAIQKQLSLHVDHINPTSSQEDILYEILLKSGFPLMTKIEHITLAGKTVFSIAEGAMLICLEKELTAEVIKAIAEKKPVRVVCLDAGFKGNDQLKTNAVQIMKSRKITDFRTV